jgi:hypothetical protein
MTSKALQKFLKQAILDELEGMIVQKKVGEEMKRLSEG